MAQKLTKKDKPSNEQSRSVNSKIRMKTLEDFKNSTVEQFGEFTESEKLKILNALGVGVEYFTCQYCGRVLSKSDFYYSSESYNRSMVTRACKSCAAEFAIPKINGIPQKPTKETVKKACYLLNKPFLNKVYDDSFEAINKVTSKMTKSDVWKEYIKNIAMPVYVGLDYSDSDDFTNFKHSVEMKKESSSEVEKIILDEYEQNKRDTIRLLNYDPFANEPELDKPYMYADLIGYLDSEDGDNIDRLKLSSIIEIIKGFVHRTKLNDIISKYLTDVDSMHKNLPTIKTIEETKKNIGVDIKNLATESKISLNSNKTANKESSTFTGKLKMLKEKKLRQQEENAYDFKTCIGFKQVAEYSAEGLLNRLAIDEAISSEIIIEQRKLLSKFKYAFDDAVERARLLFRENQDLKDKLKELDETFDDNLNSVPYPYIIDDEDEFDEVVNLIRDYQAIDMEQLIEDESEEEELEDDGEEDER